MERTDDINKQEEERLLAEQKAAKNPAKKETKQSKFKIAVKQQQQQQQQNLQDRDNYVIKCDLKSLHEAYQFLTRKYGIKNHDPDQEIPVEEFKIDLNGDSSKKDKKKDGEKTQEELELEQALQVYIYLSM